ncbi:MAG: hypothetical protein QM532_01855 [Cyanobium sp. MAG06]|nr:hypothetical protein [Cyanobium sp. MAG06]
MKTYTTLTREEIENIDREHNQNKGLRVAQKRLAMEVTTIVHGVDKMELAKNITEIIFARDNSLSDNLSKINKEAVEILKSELLSIEMNKDEYDIVEAALQCQLIKSKREGREFVEQGGLRDFDLLNNKYKLIKKGKNNFAIVSIL